MLVMKFGKLKLQKVLHQCGLQTLKVSCDLEKVVDFVVETPWIYPTNAKIEQNFVFAFL